MFTSEIIFWSFTEKQTNILFVSSFATFCIKACSDKYGIADFRQFDPKIDVGLLSLMSSSYWLPLSKFQVCTPLCFMQLRVLLTRTLIKRWWTYREGRGRVSPIYRLEMFRKQFGHKCVTYLFHVHCKFSKVYWTLGKVILYYNLSEIR